MGCNKTCNSCIVAVVISLIIAIIVGVIFTPVVVIGLVALLYTIIGLAAFFLIFLLLIALFGKRREDYCVLKNGKCLLIGSIGAIVFAALTLAFTLTEVAAAIFIAIVTFFIVLAIIQFMTLMLCTIKTNCEYKD